MYYDKEGKPIDDTIKWANMYERESYRRVGKTYVGQYFISTVWLGLNQNFLEIGPPLIFETMVFDQGSTRPWADIDMCRYSTLEQAEEGHKQMVMKYFIEYADGLDGETGEGHG